MQNDADEEWYMLISEAKEVQKTLKKVVDISGKNFFESKTLKYFCLKGFQHRIMR